MVIKEQANTQKTAPITWKNAVYNLATIFTFVQQSQHLLSDFLLKSRNTKQFTKLTLHLVNIRYMLHFRQQMQHCGKNRIWFGCCLHTMMCLSHARRLPPSSTAVLLLKKKEKIKPLRNKQTVPNPAILDVQQALRVMAGSESSLDLFSSI